MVLRLRSSAAVPVARARPRGSPEPPLRALRALHPPRRVAIIPRGASASWPLGPGDPAPDPRDPQPDHQDVVTPEWALLQILGLGDDQSARKETEPEPGGERDAFAWRNPSPLGALRDAFAAAATTTTTTTTTTTAAATTATAEAAAGTATNPSFSPRAVFVVVFAAVVVVAAHLFGAGAGAASPLAASITPVVFLTHGASLSQAAAMVAQGLHAWATNAVGVAATAAASAASGAAGYVAARRAAAAELAELRAELAALRGMVAETAAIAIAGGEKTARDVGKAAATVSAEASDPVASSAVGDLVGISAGVGVATEAEADAEAEAEARARAEAELAELRRQLARHRAVWRPGDDAAEDDGPSPFVPAASTEASPAMRTTVNDARVEELAALRAELAALRTDGDADGATTGRRAAVAPSAPSSATDGDARRREEGIADGAFDPTAAFWSGAEPTPPNASAFASSRASIPRPGTGTGARDGAGDGAGDGVGTGTSASGSSDVVDWAALAKSRAVWAPPGTSGSGAVDDDDDDDDDGSGRFGAGRASEEASEAAARARLDEEDATWRRRLNLGEDRWKDEDEDEDAGGAAWNRGRA